MSGLVLFIWQRLPTGKEKEAANMFRKFLLILLVVPLLAAAWSAGASLPLVLLMASLLLIAVASPSVHEEL
jgi:hypothetical protein